MSRTKIRGRVDVAQCLLILSGCCAVSEDRGWNLNSKLLAQFAKTVPEFLLLPCFIVLWHSDPREGQVTLVSAEERLNSGSRAGRCCSGTSPSHTSFAMQSCLR